MTRSLVLTPRAVPVFLEDSTFGDAVICNGNAGRRVAIGVERRLLVVD